MGWQAISVVACIVLLNVFSTAKVLRSAHLGTRQRVFQALLVWLIPIVGGIICLLVIASDKPSHDLTRDPNFHPEDAQWDVVPGRSSAADGD